jgi:hypothetical protein
MPPNQMPPNQMPPNQMPPSQMPPGMIPPGMMPPGMMPPGMMPPGMMPSGKMPPGMMPPGKMPPGMISPSDIKNDISMIDKLKKDVKDPIIVAIISLIFMLPQSNNLITGLNINFLINADRSINIYGLIIKALLVGIIYFFMKKYF